MKVPGVIPVRGRVGGRRGRRERRVELQRPEEIEAEGLAGEEVVEEAGAVDAGAAVEEGEFAADEGGEFGREEVGAALTIGWREVAAEEAVVRRADGEPSFLAPEGLEEARGGGERAIVGDEDVVEFEERPRNTGEARIGLEHGVPH